MEIVKTEIVTEISKLGVVTFTKVGYDSEGETAILGVETHKSVEDFEKQKEERIKFLKEDISKLEKEVEYLDNFKVNSNNGVNS